MITLDEIHCICTEVYFILNILHAIQLYTMKSKDLLILCKQNPVALKFKLQLDPK